jgi:hypothetical protein
MFIADNVQGGSTVNYATMTDAEKEASSRTYEENLAKEKREKKRKWNEIKEKLRIALTSLHQYVEIKDDEWGTGGFVVAKRAVDSPSYLSLSWDRYGSKGRVSVGVSAAAGTKYDELYRYGEARESISFDGSKTAEAMASDIKRRILPHYIEVDNRMQERIVKANAYQNTKNSVLKQLKGFAPTETESKDGKIRLELEEGYGDVSYYDETHASIDVSGIALDKVLRIMEIIRGK